MIHAMFVLRKKRAASQQTCLEQTPRGQAAVEMALLLPILLLILFGIIIAAFVFYAHIQVSNAAREGARAGSIYRMTRFDSGLSLELTVEKTIYNSATGKSSLGFLSPTSPSFDLPTDVTISLLKPDNSAGDLTDPRPGDRLHVSVVYRYTVPVVSVALPMFPQPLVMQSNVMMEIQ